MLKIKRRTTRTVKIGPLRVGSGYPIAIQSMVKVPAKDIEASIAQIRALTRAGCEIVRIAVEDKDDAVAIQEIKRRVSLPLVADIHFDYRLALASIEAGVDKVRLNPGNIYHPRDIRQVIAAARSHKIAMRIGANSGSLRSRGHGAAFALVDSVRTYLTLFKKMNFHNLVISLKASELGDAVTAYQKIALICDYPLHLGITATGLPLDGIVKSSVGLGFLLFQGIGDTIRVSLLGNPVQEVETARLLLSSLGLRKFGPELICCPTCGRCKVDLLKIAVNFEKRISRWSGQNRSIASSLMNRKIALMGCVVNGPGEARGADCGIAFSRHKAAVFKKGKVVSTSGLDQAEQVLFDLAVS